SASNPPSRQALGNRREKEVAHMTMTDPIADMLTRLRNANTSFHDTVQMPHSKLKSHIAEILKQEGYIAGFKVADAPEGQVGRVLTLELKFGPNRERSIAGLRRVSKPGLRVYAKSTGMPRVLGGLGVAIISPSTGLVAEPISVAQEDGTIAVSRPDDERPSKALHGLSRTLIANMVTGVTAGYSKTLEIVGTGYRVTARGSDLEFALGFSHPVVVTPPE